MASIYEVTTRARRSYPDHWDVYFFDTAARAARESKDPSSQVGAAIVDMTRRRCVSTGWNGFPRGVDDTPALYADRLEKYPRTIHAELNAILSARQSVEGMTLYVTPLFCCAQCAGAAIQAGIKEVRFRCDPVIPERWEANMKIAADMLHQANVPTRYFGLPSKGAP